MTSRLLLQIFGVGPILIPARCFLVLFQALQMDEIDRQAFDFDFDFFPEAFFSAVNCSINAMKLGFSISFPSMVLSSDLLQCSQPRLVGLGLPVGKIARQLTEIVFSDNFFDRHKKPRNP